MKNLAAVIALLACIVSAPGLTWAISDVETIQLDRKTEIPGSTLAPGQFKFEIEDRLRDRAIVRITEQNGTHHELVLSVPSEKLKATSTAHIIFFPDKGGDKQSVQGWKCPSCQVALEFVYPKDQAVALTQEMGRPVLAVDASYDKLPQNLSADDMKVVTMWLLAPKQVTAEGKGEGVEPTKYADLHPAPASVPAPTPAAASEPVPLVAKAHRPVMPHTASDTGNLLLAALACLSVSGGLMFRRLRQ